MKSKEIIVRFYKGKDFSQLTKDKFWYWLQNIISHKERQDALKQLYDSITVDATEDTWDDMLAMNERIMKDDLQKAGHRRLWKIAAVLLPFIFLTSVITFYWTKNYIFARRKGEDVVQVTVPSGQSRKILLADHTSVMLNSGSTLIYPEKFQSDTRKVFLIGEANLDVSKDQKRPFLIQTQDLMIRVMGTKFDVKAYQDDQVASTTLLRGRTQVYVNRGESAKDSFILTPDQSLSYDKITGQVTITKVNAQKVLSWEEGNLVFTGASFMQVLNALKRHYKMDFICSNLSVMRGDYYVKFSNRENIADVLSILNKLNHHFSYRQVGRKVYITPL